MEDVVMNEGKYVVNLLIVGYFVMEIVKLVGISVLKGMKMLIVELEGVGLDYLLLREKFFLVFVMIKVNNMDYVFDLCEGMLNFGGLGYIVVIYLENEELYVKFGFWMKVCCILVNILFVEGGIGDIYNEMILLLILGCGFYGKNFVFCNVFVVNLINVKIVVKWRNNM